LTSGGGDKPLPEAFQKEWCVLEELEIQRYLRSGKTLEDLESEYAIKHSSVGDLFIFNYSQIDSPKTERIVRECRGVILQSPNWDLVSYPFFRFFNSSEVPELHEDFNYEFATAFEKIDGCCSDDTLVLTDKGEKQIRDICESDEEVFVLTYDTETGEEEWAKVCGRSVKKNIGHWYEIETEDGKVIRLTGNHRVWVENLSCYRKVEDLDGSETLSTG
jgi:hypothetical protein